MGRTLEDPRYLKLIELLKAHRISSGLTQEQVAAAISKPQSYIAKFEGRERRLDIIEFMDLCQALNLRPSVVLKTL